MATLVVVPWWVRSEENVLVFGSLAEVLTTFLGPGKVSGLCCCVVGRRGLLATDGLALWLVSVWRQWSALLALPATPLVHTLINVGGRMYVSYPTL